jgi:allantoate deiminase/N-carbamoyl-L-amino-acid hydrolase
MTTLAELNALPVADFTTRLGDIFEHSPWVAERAAVARPFASVAALHGAMCTVVDAAGEAAQLLLIRSHPELASRAAIAGELTDASNREQRGAGLKSLTREQFERLQHLNRDYGARFGFPFIIAVKGHTPDSIIAQLAARIEHDPLQEQRTALEQIARIARFRLEELVADDTGNELIARHDELAKYSDQPDGLTCAYLTAAHQSTARLLRDYMLAAGLTTHIDAVGNVVGRLEAATPTAGTLLTGSHYDTVSNAGRYDGRLGILLPVSVAARLRRAGRTLPFHLEIIGFAEEEGLRFQSTFLGSSAIAGCFDNALLDARDRDGTSMRAALLAAGHDPAQIPQLARRRDAVLGFVEVHIEQGPVLLDAGRGVGLVTGIAGSRRSLVEITGLAGHAGTVPMTLRRDAAAGAAEIVLLVESRCAREPGLVGTVGQLQVPGGATNVIPGRCLLSIDLRSVDDALRARAAADIDAGIAGIAKQRGLATSQRIVLDVPAVPCTPALQRQFAASIERVTGTDALALPSGAGHDTMMMARLTDVGMLFVRCGNGGISHHPDEALTAADAALAADVFQDFLLNYKAN